MKLYVHQIHPHGADVRELRLRAADGAALPAWPAGAHLQVRLPGADGAPPLLRHYSLIGAPGATQEYRIAVLRDPASRGGSRQMHALREGDALDVDGPIDRFPLAAQHAGRVLLVAGGIGITPLHAMAHALSAQGQAVTLHYLARSAERLVLLDELRALPGLSVHLHVGARPELPALLGPARVGDRLYACGPVQLLNALRSTAAGLGWPANAVQVESFGARSASADAPVRLHLAHSGVTLDVPPGTSLLQAMLDAGQFVAYDCQRGECGQCWTAVEAGEPEHRDVCLSAAQRAQGMCPCVSWAKGGELCLAL